MGRAHARVEREKPDPQRARHLNQVRCIANGLEIIVPGNPYQDLWSRKEKESHINRLELLAAFIAVKTFLES